MTSNGQAATTEAPRTSTAADHVAAAESLLEDAADCEYDDRDAATYYVARAQVHATLAVALADQRIADDEDRIASCVPDGLDSLSVSVRGQR